MEKDVRKNFCQCIQKLNITEEEMELLAEVYAYAKEKNYADLFKIAIREINSDSGIFKRFMEKEPIRAKYGEDFEFAKLMVTKINPNTMLAFKVSMLVPEKGLKIADPARYREVLTRRQFFVNYFLNECDVTPNGVVKVSKVCDMGFMTNKEVDIFKDKRREEITKDMPKNNYNGDNLYRIDM